MNTILPLLGLLLQLVLAGAGFIWVLAYLGFADDTRRGTPVSLFGRLLAGICILLAIVPVLLVFYVGWGRYFPSGFYRPLPLGIFLPLAATLGCGLVCTGLIYLFKTIGYRRR